MVLKRSAQNQKAADVERDGNVACPEAGLGLEYTAITPDGELKDGVVGIAPDEFAYYDSNLCGLLEWW